MMRFVGWLDSPESHDFVAAYTYLSLCFPDDRARALAEKLKRVPHRVFRVNDVLRAAELPLLGASDPHVHKTLKHIRGGNALSPVLLVRDKRKLIVADGYHRICGVYHFDTDALVRCRLIDA